MTKPPSLAADVLITAEVSPEQQQAIVEAFATLQVAVRTRVIPPRRGIGDLPILMLAALPLQAFVTGLGSKAAQDAYQRLGQFVDRLLGNRSRESEPEQVLVLEDTATRLQIVLEADLPGEAYQRLVQLDLAGIRKGPLHYDRYRGEWRSELAEWEQRQP